MTRTAWYTFGNHFHWVDMQWLWGYGVLGDSVRDMLALTDATGAPGNINFDGVGYERMASEDPAALQLLREALQDRRVEVVGATYGQSYGLFHHGESAVRQLTYGVRAAQRVLGVRPRSFWEEEFYFFPQLPQLLVDAGYAYASLFFQWTWHTPEVPSEDAPAVWWSGVDGSRILTLPRGPLNLHQWPEDFEALLTNPLLAQSPAPVVQQWLELLPSPDWMCRAELVVHGVRDLFERSEVHVESGTMSTVLEAVREHAVERTYTMDDVFHGMSLGKNGDHGHRRSRRLEQSLLDAEVLSVLAGSRGRPYPHWGAYPAWELEEAWRELLAFQHHDNDECEGLCGHVGYAGLVRAEALVAHVTRRTTGMIASRTPGDGPRRVAINPLAWDRSVVIDAQRWSVPAMGVTVLDDSTCSEQPQVAVVREAGLTVLVRGDFRVSLDDARGVVTAVGDIDCGSEGLGNLRWERDGVPWDFPADDVVVNGRSVVVRRRGSVGERISVSFSLADDVDALDIHFFGELGSGPDDRVAAALMTLVEPDLEVTSVLADTPYAIAPVEGRGTFTRKYPTGEWMTSQQRYEQVVDPFTALQLVDLCAPDGHGLLWLHDGSQAFHRARTGAWNVLSLKDAWDEGYYNSALDARVRVVPHGLLDDATRWRLAQEHTRPVLVESVDQPVAERPLAAALMTIRGAGVVATATYRDSELAQRTSPDHVNTVCGSPVPLVRLVELNGEEAQAVLRPTGTLGRAWRTNTLGEVEEELPVVAGEVSVPMRPHGITTVALDVAEWRPVDRNLDSHREVWAQAHKIDQPDE